MRNLLFLSRVAFLCNLCFLVSLALRYMNIGNGFLSSTLIVTGHVLALIINASVVVLLFMLAAMRRLASLKTPPWLLLTNIVFFVVQVLFLIK